MRPGVDPAELESLPQCDVVVVGAGFSGLYALHRLRTSGPSVRLFEQGSGVGGTWFWNRYPGARCDLESVDYSYSFSEELEQEWEWTERYPSQPELERYLNHVADRFDLWRDIRLRARVTQCHYRAQSGRWLVGTEDGQRCSARFCVMATGVLSAVNRPDLEGLDSFRGQWYHTARWPRRDVDLIGKRVGVIGTGSSGIQVITAIHRHAGHVWVFQRTANFSVPAMNRQLPPEVVREIKAHYRERRHAARESRSGLPGPENHRCALDFTPEERSRELESRWNYGGFGSMRGAFADLLTNPEANECAAEFIRSKIRATVRDPAVAEKLLPCDHPFATKRPCVDTGYFEAFNRDNVALVDLRESPLREITPRGVRTADAEYELDVIIFATGFDAMTGALRSIDIEGRDGVTLNEKWAEGPRTFLGIASAGFPNMFIVTGPGSPSVLSNMIVSIEQHVNRIDELIAYLGDRHLGVCEATLQAEDAWVARVHDLARGTLHMEANPWYNGANVPGKPRVFMPYIGGVGEYRRICDQVAAGGYQGFALSFAAPVSGPVPAHSRA